MNHLTHLEVDHLGKTYRTGKKDVCALKDVSFKVQAQEFITIVGPSGCGKTTLLKIVGGLLSKSKGDALINGVSVSKSSEKIGVVFQTPALLPWRTIFGNIHFPLEFYKPENSKDEVKEEIQNLINLTKLKGFEDAYPYELSGGMCQRVSICRALIFNPRLLLMDEPFGALDALTRDELNMELLQIWADRKPTVLFVTHNIPEAVYLGDRLIVLSPRPAVVTSDIRIDLPRPRHLDIRRTNSYIKYVEEIREKIGVYY